MNEALEANLQAKLTDIANAQRKLQREHAQVCIAACHLKLSVICIAPTHVVYIQCNMPI